MMRVFRLIVTVVVSSAPMLAVDQDQDRDGLPDVLEQQLLARFAPSFLVARGDCARGPAEFAPGIQQPTPLANNGTIYGQAFRPDAVRRAGAVIELHYYHLWAVDCGTNGHPLDAEHVSALVEADRPDAPIGAWTAKYWYASAHQGTICNANSGARAARIGAERSGPPVWVSKGKHASFLRPDLCDRGCGGDECADTEPLRVGAIVNIGEPGAPMNGAVWADSPVWQLSRKMKSDFQPQVLAVLDSPDAQPVTVLRTGAPGMQRTVSVANTTLGGITTADRKTDSALATATDKTDRALDGSAGSVGRALRGSWRAVGRFLKGKNN